MSIKFIAVLLYVPVVISFGFNFIHNLHSFKHKYRLSPIINNVCKTAKDYDTINENKDCWYNEDVDFTPVSITVNTLKKKKLNDVFLYTIVS